MLGFTFLLCGIEATVALTAGAIRETSRLSGWNESSLCGALKGKKDGVTGGEFKSPNHRPSVNTGAVSVREKKNCTWTWE